MCRAPWSIDVYIGKLLVPFPSECVRIMAWSPPGGTLLRPSVLFTFECQNLALATRVTATPTLTPNPNRGLCVRFHTANLGSPMARLGSVCLGRFHDDIANRRYQQMRLLDLPDLVVRTPKLLNATICAAQFMRFSYFIDILCI